MKAGITDKIKRARCLMHGSTEVTKNKCSSCGRMAGAVLINKAIKTSFTDIEGLIISDGEFICNGCISLLKDPDMRFKPLLFTVAGKQVLERPQVLEILQNPPEGDFVITLPYSFKKHHWVFAGLSNKNVIYVGTDNRCILLDNHFTSVVLKVRSLLLGGVSRGEIKLGEYKTTTLSRKYHAIKAAEEVLAKHRASGAVELAVTYSPALDKGEKINIEERIGLEMLNESEQNAANILAVIAESSNFRVERGLDFWGGFFERRVNRYRNKPFKTFLSSLGASIGSDVKNTEIAFIVEGLTEKQEHEIMETISEKAHLMVTFAYTKMRERRAKKQ